MANPEHLAILKQGVEAWNAWRKENPEVTPDLRGGEFNTGGCNMQEFPAANLRKVRLDGAEIWSGGLVGADLREASLWEAHLYFTDLQDADLRGAQLVEARLHFVYLVGAKLAGVTLGRGVIYAADLSQVVGLDEVKHMAPTSIASGVFDETAKGLSTGDPSRLTEIDLFYERAGVASHLIEYYRSRAGRAIEFFSSFISYSHTDKPFARRLHDQLQGKGIRCWLDEKELKIGEEILPGVLGAIRLHDRVILCCSEASLNSEWVETELEETFEKEQKEGRPILLPLNLDGYLLKGWKGPLAVKVRKRLAADFTGWEQDNAKFEEQFERVVEALRA